MTKKNSGTKKVNRGLRIIARKAGGGMKPEDVAKAFGAKIITDPKELAELRRRFPKRPH